MEPQQPSQEPPYQQPQYQQPQYQPPYQPASPGGAGRGSSSVLTSLGADIMAGLAYLIVLIPVAGFVLQIVLFAVEKNRFTKFHAAQAMILSIVWYVLGFISFIVSSIFTAGSRVDSTFISFLSGGVGLLFSCVFGLLFLGLFALWIWGMVSGFTGKPTKLPVIGDFAENLSGGPLGP